MTNRLIIGSVGRKARSSFKALAIITLLILLLILNLQISLSEEDISVATQNKIDQILENLRLNYENLAEKNPPKVPTNIDNNPDVPKDFGTQALIDCEDAPSTWCGDGTDDPGNHCTGDNEMCLELEDCDSNDECINDNCEYSGSIGTDVCLNDCSDHRDSAWCGDGTDDPGDFCSGNNEMCSEFKDCDSNDECISDNCEYSGPLDANVCLKDCSDHKDSDWCGDGTDDPGDFCSGDNEMCSNSEQCDSDDECISDNCVHGTCRAGTTHCGDGYCDNGEDGWDCASDCGNPCDSDQCTSSNLWKSCHDHGDLCCTGDNNNGAGRTYGQWFCKDNNNWAQCDLNIHPTCQQQGGYFCAKENDIWKWRTCANGCNANTGECNVVCDYSPGCSYNENDNCYDADTVQKRRKDTLCNGGCSNWINDGKLDCAGNEYCKDPGDAFCATCSTSCDNSCQSAACHGTDPDCGTNGGATKTCCGDGQCDGGETSNSCSADCAADIRIEQFVNPPTTANEGQAVTIQVKLKNHGNVAGTTKIEAAIAPDKWDGILFSDALGSESVTDSPNCCPGNDYYDAKEVSLNPGQEETVTFNVNAPTQTSTDTCSPRDAWDTSFTLVAGTYPACGNAYTDKEKRDFTVNVLCDYSPVCNDADNDDCHDSNTLKLYHQDTACEGGCTGRISDGFQDCNSDQYCYEPFSSYDAECKECSRACDNQCQSGACFGLDPDCNAQGGKQGCCGNGFCDGGETASSCANDCRSELRIENFVSPPTSAEAGDSVTFTVGVKNHGTITGTTKIEGAIVPDSWKGTIFSEDLGAQIYSDSPECCPGNAFYDAKEVTLGPGETNNIQFTVIAPNPDSTDDCGDRSAWDTSFTLLAGMYPECKNAYTDQEENDFTVTSNCDYDPECGHDVKRVCTDDGYSYDKFLAKTACDGSCNYDFEANYPCEDDEYCQGTAFDDFPCYTCSTACDSACQSKGCAGIDPDCDVEGKPNIICCGDGSCDAGEDENNCENDCKPGVCGDGVCNNGETCNTCTQDCGQCDCSVFEYQCNAENTKAYQDCFWDPDVSSCICNYYGCNYGCDSSIADCKTCGVADGSDYYCDCDSNSDCPSDKPYCEDSYPEPISNGFDACLSTEPEYCGDGICNNGEDFLTCANDCASLQGDLIIDVTNNGNPLQGAKVFVNNFVKGTTNAAGRKTVKADYYETHRIVVKCADDTFCDLKDVYLNSPSNYNSFECGCQQASSEIKVSVKSPTPPDSLICGLAPVALAYVAMDNRVTGLTNELGEFTFDSLGAGVHDLDIILHTGEGINAKQYCVSRQIQVNTDFSHEEFVLNLENVNQCNLLDYQGLESGKFQKAVNNIESQGLKFDSLCGGPAIIPNTIESNQFTPSFACGGVCIVAVVVIALEYGAIAWDGYDAGKCAIEHGPNDPIQCADETFWLVGNFVAFDAGLISYGRRAIRWGSRLLDSSRFSSHILKVVKASTKYITKYGIKAKKVTIALKGNLGNSIQVIADKTPDGVIRILELLSNAGDVVKTFAQAVKVQIQIFKHGDDAIRIGDNIINKFPPGTDPASIRGELGESLTNEYLKLTQEAIQRSDEAKDGLKMVIHKGSPDEVFAETSKYIYAWGGGSRKNGESLNMFKKGHAYVLNGNVYSKAHGKKISQLTEGEWDALGKGGALVGELDGLVEINNRLTIVESKVRRMNSAAKSKLKADRIKRTKIDPIEELIQENPLGKQWAESPDLLLMVPSDQVSNANTAEWVTKLGGKVDDFGKSYDDLIHLSEDLIIK